MPCVCFRKYDIGNTVSVSFQEFQQDFYVIEEHLAGNGYASGICYCNECRTAYLWDYEYLIHEKLRLKLLTKKSN